MNEAKELTVREVAAMCRSSRASVTSWITFGVEGIRLKAKRAGKKWLVLSADLDAFRDALTNKALGLEGTKQPAPDVVRRDKINARAKAAKERLKARGVPINT